MGIADVALYPISLVESIVCMCFFLVYVLDFRLKMTYYSTKFQINQKASHNEE